MRAAVRLLVAVACLISTSLADPGRIEQSAQGWTLDREEVLDSKTVLTFRSAGAQRTSQGLDVTLPSLCAVPPDARAVSILVDGSEVPCPTSTGGLWVLRDMAVVPLVLDLDGRSSREPSQEARIEIHHDGSWERWSPELQRHGRGLRAAVRGLVAGNPPAPSSEANGAYVVITTDALAPAVQTFVDWKLQMGFDVRLATTSAIGSTAAAIRDWLREAYESWEVPPEYVLLIGDVGDVPTWEISNTATDHPYSLMNDGDWLPDLLVGRFSVATALQAATISAKSVGYERTPYVSNPGWFARALVVAGNYGANTPVSDARFCRERLLWQGFTQVDSVYFPPHYQGVSWIQTALNAGRSIVAFRGWAYGVYGWEPPHFTTDDVATLSNGWMLPVVLSFTCQNGDITAPECFGETWLRAGTPTQPKGGVAFVGATEPWTHTRYNDALAISFFELLGSSISDMGGLVLAAKLRFMEYFPHELDVETHGEESVEFYFHTYNLLGDPSLGLRMETPRTLTVSHAASAAAGCNYVEVSVRESDGVTPVAGARVGMSRGSALLGCGFTDEGGLAHVSIPSIGPGPDLLVTVTHPNCLPYQGTAAVTGEEPFVGLLTYELDDQTSGNGDGLASPGESVEILVALINGGSGTATDVTALLESNGPASVDQGVTPVPDIPGGTTAVADQPFRVTLDAAVEDQLRIRFLLQATHGAAGSDSSDLFLPVSAPRLVPAQVLVSGDGMADPGETVSLVLVLRNDGTVSTNGAVGLLTAMEPEPVTVVDSVATFGTVEPGGTATNDQDPFEIRIGGQTAIGTALSFRLQLETVEGYRQETAFSLLVGDVASHDPSGPDAYGHFAYDNTDVDYPDERPDFYWQALSPSYGGAGTLLLSAPGSVSSVVVSLPFTFRYYGADVNALRVYRNGFVTFDTAEYYDFYNWPLPSRYGSHSTVAPFWDTLSSTDPNQDGVYYLYDPAGGSVTIEWSHLRHHNPDYGEEQTFQLVLLDPAAHPTPSGDGEMLFLYQTIANVDSLRNFATIGIEAPSEDDGLQYGYAGLHAAGATPLAPGLAIKFTTVPPRYSPPQIAIGESPAPGVRMVGSAPNPSRPRTEILFDLPRGMVIRLSIYDAAGRRVRTLLDASPCTAGRNRAVWDGLDDGGRSAASGVYYYELRTEGVVHRGEMVLMR